MGSAAQYKVKSSRIISVIFFVFYSSGRICLIPFLTLFFRDLGYSPLNAGIIRGCQTLVTILAIPLLISCAKASHRWRCVLILPLIISVIMYMILIMTQSFNGVYNSKVNCNDYEIELKNNSHVSSGPAILQNKSSENVLTAALNNPVALKNSSNKMPSNTTAFTESPSNSSAVKFTLSKLSSSPVKPNFTLTTTTTTTVIAKPDSQILNTVNESRQYLTTPNFHNSTESYKSFNPDRKNASHSVSPVPQTDMSEKISSQNMLNALQSTHRNNLPNKKYLSSYYNSSLTVPIYKQNLDHTSYSEEYMLYPDNDYSYKDNTAVSNSEELFKDNRSHTSLERALNKRNIQRVLPATQQVTVQEWITSSAKRLKAKTVPPTIALNNTEKKINSLQLEHNAILKNNSTFQSHPTDLERNNTGSTPETPLNVSRQSYILNSLNETETSFPTYFWIVLIIGVIGEAFGASVEVSADEAWFRFLDEIDYIEKYQQHFIAASVGSTFAAFGISAIASNSACHLSGGVDRFAIHCYAFSIIMILVSIIAYYFPVPHQRSLVSEKWSRISVVKIIFSDIRTVLMTFAVIISGACNAGLHDYFLWYMEDIGTKEYILGLAVSLAAFSEIPVHLGYRWILKWTTLYGCVSLSLICYSLRFLYSAFVTSPWALIPVQLLHSLSTALMWRVIHVYVDQISSPGTDRKVYFMFQIIYWAFGYVLGTVLGGFLYTWSGPKSFLLTMAISAFVFSFLFLIAQYYLPRLQRRTYSKILFEGLKDGEERIYHSIGTESDDENDGSENDDDNDDWLEKAIRITAQEKRHKT